jgi:small conductance mechanosensitive channel
MHERPDEDPTRVTDISYYRDSPLARLLAGEAAERARRARREVFVLAPLVLAVVLLWRFREDLFGTDVPVRVVAAVLLAAIGWRLARDLGRALGPRLLRRFDPGSASTVAFLVQLTTLLVVVIVALRLVKLEPGTIAIGGAVTAVVLGLGAQSALGNVIAGTVLIGSRPFRVGERVRMQGGTLGKDVEGTVANLGLLYTTLARGDQKVLVPNSAVLGATIVPLREPAGVDLVARLDAGVKPSDVQRLLADRVTTPTRDEPHISLEEVHGDEVKVRVTATPVSDADGAKLADEVLAALATVATRSSVIADGAETNERS